VGDRAIPISLRIHQVSSTSGLEEMTVEHQQPKEMTAERRAAG
jgi:hypothetical protein